MNEANNMFEDASRGPSGTLTKEDKSQFNQSMQGLADSNDINKLIKPEYLDNTSTN